MPLFPADDKHLELAARRLREGELVAFPTETVYGLGANALDADAVAKIYAVKGRPSFNPLIVHVTDVEAARNLTTSWNEKAEALAQAFWPGPLTLVLPKVDAIPSIISAGLPTVALRVPAHPVAQRLLSKSGIPLAAPSANKSTEVSPTRAQHVLESLEHDMWVLDGGECAVGIESTVVDVSTGIPSILRPGTISALEIEALVGSLVEPSVKEETAPRPAPGMMLRHYSPRAQVHIFPTLTDANYHAVLLGSGEDIGVLAFAPTWLKVKREVLLPLDPAEYARQLYAQLREFDAEGIGLILIEEVPNHLAWAGVRDRLQRASQAKDSS